VLFRSPLNHLAVTELPGHYEIQLDVAEFQVEDVHTTLDEMRLDVLALGDEGRSYLSRVVELDEPVRPDSVESEVRDGSVHVRVAKRHPAPVEETAQASGKVQAI